MTSSLFLLLGALGARTARSQEIFWNFRGAFAPSSDVRCPQNQYQTVKHERGQDNEFKTLADVQLCCAMGPPGGGRNPVTPRFLRHFNIVGLSDVTDATLGRIFCTILMYQALAASVGPSP